MNSHFKSNDGNSLNIVKDKTDYLCPLIRFAQCTKWAEMFKIL